MISSFFKEHLEDQLGDSILSGSPLVGGDINSVLLLNTEGGKKVIKINKKKDFPGLFEKEKEGLEALDASITIRVPKAFKTGNYKEFTYLILEYIESKEKRIDFWESFGQKLSLMHQKSNEKFGFKNSNYIGSLPQKNQWCDTAVEFYISQRLMPQFKLAGSKGYYFKNIELFYKRIEGVIPVEPPALIHGDLWNGNYIIDETGDVCLIDPSVAFFHREMDIAMMHLFRGFDQRLFDSYQSISPLEKEWEKRMDIWQLYYLIVHLNLFGSSYLNSVDQIIKKYTS